MAKRDQVTEQQAKGASKGPGSFCVPRAAVEALLDAKANAYEICSYLVLAKCTDESGQYSAASIKAINTATGGNKLKDGPAGRAIERLKTIRARSITKVSNGRSGTKHAMIDREVDLGPILIERTAWQAQTGEILPDGPTGRGLIRNVLPDFGEEKQDRVWFGNNLVVGIGRFNQPLKALKNAGDVAARLLLAMYAANDMELWGGVSPKATLVGVCNHYAPVADDILLNGGARLIRAKFRGGVTRFDQRISSEDKACWDALLALKTVGLMYEVVMVLNRNATKRKFSNTGEEYGAIPDDAEPYYELDARSEHGFKPEGEAGIGSATANTAGELGFPVAVEGGRLDGTYAAIVPSGCPAMIAGIYRLRFRVANPKNAGVKGAWARIHQNNREAFELVQAIRAANKKTPLIPPWKDDAQRPSPSPAGVGAI